MAKNNVISNTMSDSKSEGVTDKMKIEESSNSQNENVERIESPPPTPDELEIQKYSKHQFNINRKVVIKNTPPCTYNDVKEFLGTDYKVKNILVSKRSRHAVVILMDGSQAESICEKLTNSPLHGVPVEVALYKNENFLCIAHLPLNVSDLDFKGLVSELGLTERVFLMRDIKGKSKGYGFVEYAHNYEKTKQACNLLNGKRMGSCILQCCFVKESILSFDQLHSSCLFIDHLPPNYTEKEEFNQIFHLDLKPLYCRLAVEQERGLGFGIVEYENASVAETVSRKLHGTSLKKYSIRVTYCIPGLSATELYEKHSRNMSMQMPRSGGLLPDPLLTSPPGGSLLGSPHDALPNPTLKSLLSNNPKVLDDFQGTLTSLQQLQTARQDGGKPGMLGPGPRASHNPLLNPELQISILACVLAKQLEENQPAIFNNPLVQQFLSTNASLTGGGLFDSDKPSLLGNPLLAQANRMLVGLSRNETDSKSVIPPDRSQGNVPNALKDFKSLLSAVGGPLDEGTAERPGGLLGDAPGDVELSEQIVAPPQNKKEEYGNPLLALIIESQIRQQLQGMQALNFLGSFRGPGSEGSGPNEPRAPLLGNAPPGYHDPHGGPPRPSMGPGDWQGSGGLMGRRPPLLDGPPRPGMDGGDYRGRGRGWGGGRGRGFGPEGGHAGGEWSGNNSDQYTTHQTGGETDSGWNPPAAPKQDPAMYQQMYQMYQDYLHNFNQKQQDNSSPTGTSAATATDVLSSPPPSQDDDDDSSEAVFSSGIANQPAFSTGVSTYEKKKSQNPLAGLPPGHATQLAAFFKHLEKFSVQMANQPSGGATGQTSHVMGESNPPRHNAPLLQTPGSDSGPRPNYTGPGPNAPNPGPSRHPGPNPAGPRPNFGGSAPSLLGSGPRSNFPGDNSSGLLGSGPGENLPGPRAPGPPSNHGNQYGQQDLPLHKQIRPDPPYSQSQMKSEPPYSQSQNKPEPYSQSQNKPEAYSQSQNRPEPYSQSQNRPEPYSQSQNRPEPYSQSQNRPEPYSQSQNRPEPYSQSQNRPEHYSQSQNKSEPYSQNQARPELSYSQSKPSTQPPYSQSQKQPPPQGLLPDPGSQYSPPENQYSKDSYGPGSSKASYGPGSSQYSGPGSTHYSGSGSEAQYGGPGSSGKSGSSLFSGAGSGGSAPSQYGKMAPPSVPHTYSQPPAQSYSSSSTSTYNQPSSFSTSSVSSDYNKTNYNKPGNYGEGRLSDSSSSSSVSSSYGNKLTTSGLYDAYSSSINTDSRRFVGTGNAQSYSKTKSYGGNDQYSSSSQSYSSSQGGFTFGGFNQSMSPPKKSSDDTTYSQQYSTYRSAANVDNAVVSTPQAVVQPPGRGIKRSHLLPSPEPSPEGNYVGQHSQGLGGHYATSYKKRKL